MKNLQLGLPPKDEDIVALKNQLTVTPVRGTDFLEITAKHPSQKQATFIANAVAEAFISQRIERQQHRKDQALEALDEEIQLQVELLEAHKIEFEKTCRQHDLGDPFLTNSLPGIPEVERAFHARIERESPNQEVCDDINLLKRRFQQSKDDYLQARDMLRDMMIKHQETREHFKIPQTPITIHQRAQ